MTLQRKVREQSSSIRRIIPSDLNLSPLSPSNFAPVDAQFRPLPNHRQLPCNISIDAHPIHPLPTFPPQYRENTQVVVRLVLPNGNQSAVKVSPETTMEDILRAFCEKKGLDFEQHTLQFQGLPLFFRFPGLVHSRLITRNTL